MDKFKANPQVDRLDNAPSVITRGVCCLAGVLVGSLVLLADTSAARDRPGTPINVKVRAEPAVGPEDKPAVTADFWNTATEEVRFEMLMTANGKPVDPSGKLGCLRDRGPATYIGADQCFSPSRKYKGKTGDIGSGGHGITPLAFIVRDLEYNTTYCFRFRARRTSDDVVSKLWTNWDCATTQAAAPPAPGKRIGRRQPDTRSPEEKAESEAQSAFVKSNFDIIPGDLRGSDIRSFGASQIYDCAKACLEDAQCKAFTLVKPDQKCWLKSGVPALSAAPTPFSMFSGVRKAAAAPSPTGPTDEKGPVTEAGADCGSPGAVATVVIDEPNLRKLNIREKPGGAIVGTVPKDSQVTVMGSCGADAAGLRASAGGWCQIDSPVQGCVMAKYLSFGGAGGAPDAAGFARKRR